MTAVLAVTPAGAAAVAQPPHSVSGPAPAASTDILTERALGGICMLATATDGMVRMARTSASGRLMSLPHAGAYPMRYRYCRPGRAAVPAFGPLQRFAVQRTGRITWLRAAGSRVARAPGTSGPPDVGGLTGRVTSPAGKPLAGICVWVERDGAAGEVETTSSGTYGFGANIFEPGRYLVLFLNCGPAADPFAPLAPGPWAPEWYKAAFARSKATVVVLRAHRVTRGINAVMRHAAQISGVVTGSDGRRLANTCVFAMTGPTLPAGLATTNRGGAYKITGLDPGSYRVLAMPDCGAGSVYGQAYYPRAQTFGAARAVTVRLGHLTGGINVTVLKLGTISGVIRLGGKTGKPLGGFCVDAQSATDPTADDGQTVSAANGTYSIVGLPAGSWEVGAVTGCGNDGNYTPASYPHPVRVVNGKVASGIDLFPQPGGTLTGTVTDASTAKPIGGICVMDDQGDFGTTNAAGTFTIDQLPAERTIVSFAGGCGSSGSYTPQFYDDQVTQEAARPIVISAGHVTSGINAAMRPGATIAGRVVNSAGRPVPGVCVGIVPADLVADGFFPFAVSTTNSSGSYAVANLAPGDYAAAFVSGCAGPSNAAALQWFKGQPTEETAGLIDARAGRPATGIDAVVSPGGSISGTVTSTQREGPDFLSCVTATNRQTGQTSQFIPTNDGFTISGLVPGTYTVIASDCVGANLAQSVYPRPVTVRAGLTTGKIVLKLVPGGVVTGRITAAGSGRPVPNACVVARAASGAAASLGIGSDAVTSRSGTYKIVGLRSGSYRVAVFPNCTGSAVNLRTVTLPHSVPVTQGKVTARVNAVLRAGGTITGQVTGPGAAAVPGACVEPFQIPGGAVGFPGDAVTGAKGRYVLTGLAPGRYKVEFGDPFCSDGAAGLGTQWYNGAADSGSATVITVTAGRTASAVNAALPADGTITGSVTGPSASPLSGVCVSAVPVAKGEPAIFTVSGSGTYTLAGLLPGKYRAEFQAGCGQAGVKTQWWAGATSSAAAQIITVSPGATVSAIDAVMTG
jgi:hypothetical protein